MFSKKKDHDATSRKYDSIRGHDQDLSSQLNWPTDCYPIIISLPILNWETSWSSMKYYICIYVPKKSN